MTKPIPFLEDWWRDDEENGGFLREHGGHHTFSYKPFSLSPSQILVCAMDFAAHYLFSFWDLHWLRSLSKKNKRVGRYIGTSLYKSQDFSHNDMSA